ncbi:MAG: hypothetical protein AAF467_14145 [Actinomycetota bacterium]
MLPLTRLQTTLLLAAVLLVVGFFTLQVARRVTVPVDNFVTEQACTNFGNRFGRPVVEYETATRFSRFDTSEGSCTFGPVEPPDIEEDVEELEVLPDIADSDVVRVTLLDTEPGPLYDAAKVMIVILQLGLVSLALRVVGVPLFNRLTPTNA